MKSDELREELKLKRKGWHDLLVTTIGASLVEWLEINFDHDKLFVPDNQHQTAYRLGQRDVVRLLKEIAKDG